VPLSKLGVADADGRERSIAILIEGIFFGDQSERTLSKKEHLILR